jgi:tryptophanyl-tRNA synthetase
LIVSGIQPTGTITLGNYLGAISNWLNFQKEHECLFFVADLHALTANTKNLQENSRKTLALLLACGIDPKNLFLQSSVNEHTSLLWVLTCNAGFGELKRMVQFKDKSETITNAGLFTYPVLQASDILLYQANKVPIGQDQKQHLELAANIATRFNQQFGETFTIPKAIFTKNTKKVMHLLDPTVKMSKSHPNQMGVINLLESEKDITNKFKRAVTDSFAKINYTDEQPGIKNLIDIAKAFDENFDTNVFNHQYGKLKLKVANIVIENLLPIQNEYTKIIKDQAFLEEVIKNGQQRAKDIASKTMELVYKKVSLR